MLKKTLESHFPNADKRPSSLNIAVLAWFVPFEEHFFDGAKYLITGNHKNANDILQKIKKDDHSRRLICQSRLADLPKTTSNQESIQEILADFCPSGR